MRGSNESCVCPANYHGIFNSGTWAGVVKVKGGVLLDTTKKELPKDRVPVCPWLQVFSSLPHTHTLLLSCETAFPSKYLDKHVCSLPRPLQGGIQ